MSLKLRMQNLECVSLICTNLCEINVIYYAPEPIPFKELNASVKTLVIYKRITVLCFGRTAARLNYLQTETEVSISTFKNPI